MRPCVISIAGFDPSAGAGVLADIKTFENLRVYGFGVCSALTYQDDVTFTGLDWVSEAQIIRQLGALTEQYVPLAIKIGLIESLDSMEHILEFIKDKWPECQIVWDPILKASAGFEFHSITDKVKLESILKLVDVVTPNTIETVELGGGDLEQSAAWMAGFTNVLVKGGHKEQGKGVDTLYSKGGGASNIFAPTLQAEKHGSGCVYSSALTAHLALGKDLKSAAKSAKQYIHDFLQSNDTLLGYHAV